MNGYGASIRRAVTAAHKWSVFLVAVCVVALLNTAFWSAHPALERFAGLDWLTPEMYAAHVSFVALLLIWSTVAFSVTGLVETVAATVRQ